MSATDKRRKGKSKLTSAQAYKAGNRMAINKAKRAKRTTKAIQKKADKIARRRIAHKPERGSARSIRRERERAAALKAAASKIADSAILS